MCSSVLPVCMDVHFVHAWCPEFRKVQKKQLEGVFILAPHFRLQFIVSGKSQQQDLVGAGHITSIIRNREQ